MSKISPAKLTLEDFPNQRDWIGPLFSLLNTFTGDVINAFSNATTIQDNLYQEIKELRFVNTTALFPLRFKTKFSSAPKGLMPIYLYNNTTVTYSTAQPWVQWSYASGILSISSVSGLTASSDYTMRLLVLYG